jgi:hypothetical protein
MAAELALLIGEDAKPYRDEATKIMAAVDRVLWMADKGTYAEFKDALGLKSIHPNAGCGPCIIASIVICRMHLKHIKHYAMLIRTSRISRSKQRIAGGYYTLSTSNWMPYSWSLNNVALAELMHTSLANWEGGRNEEAFLLMEKFFTRKHVSRWQSR